MGSFSFVAFSLHPSAFQVFTLLQVHGRFKMRHLKSSRGLQDLKPSQALKVSDALTQQHSAHPGAAGSAASRGPRDKSQASSLLSIKTRNTIRQVFNEQPALQVPYAP
ncbi:hypothetical protein B0H13DRAFT_1901345 [Mycena leptocephala]|nr:hypothetical protein B0H13DRAFT_1901345 [Mycena leptocephala]